MHTDIGVNVGSAKIQASFAFNTLCLRRRNPHWNTPASAKQTFFLCVSQKAGVPCVSPFVFFVCVFCVHPKTFFVYQVRICVCLHPYPNACPCVVRHHEAKTIEIIIKTLILRVHRVSSPK